MELTQAQSHSPILILSPVSEATHIQSKFSYTAEHEPELPFSDHLPKKRHKVLPLLQRYCGPKAFLKHLDPLKIRNMSPREKSAQECQCFISVASLSVSFSGFNIFQRKVYYFSGPVFHLNTTQGSVFCELD